MTINADVRAALEQRRRHRLASGVEVVDIYGSVGGGYVMALDGRIFEWNLDIEGREVLDPVKMRLALMLGSRVIPELKLLVPRRPIEAVDCAQCQGSGERGLGEQLKWLCDGCGGVGWTQAP